MEHSSRTRLLSAVVIAAVFGAGVLIGFAADTNLGAQPPEAATTAPKDEETERPPPMYTQLDPTADQQLVIDSIIAVHRERTNALDKETRRAFRSGFRQILLETRQAIKEVFPAEKGAEYQRLLDEYDAKAAADREDRAERN